MKSLFLAALIIFCTSAFAETLQFSKFGLTAETEWIKAPSSSKETVMKVQFLDERSAPTEIPATLVVDLFMPDMGHGSGPTALERIMDNDDVVTGAYKVKNMWFIMPGTWQVRVTLTKGTKTETQMFNVKI